MLHYKEYIYCVYKTGSFSKAADKLCISQPSLSIAVKKAEEEAGFPIFDRRKHPISLTEFGVEYIRAVEQIHDIENRLNNYAEDLEKLEQGTLIIGGSNFSVENIISASLAEFKIKYPHVNLEIRETNTLSSLHMLDSGELDLAITNRPLDMQKYISTFIYQEHLILAVPRSFLINKKFCNQQLTESEIKQIIFSIPQERSVNLKDFIDTPFIMLRSGNYLRQCVDNLFQECWCAPHTILEFEQSAVSYNFASFGLGATILSNMLIEKSPKNDRLCFYKINSKLALRNTYISYSKNNYVSFAMKKYIELLKNKCNAFHISA